MIKYLKYIFMFYISILIWTSDRFLQIIFRTFWIFEFFRITHWIRLIIFWIQKYFITLYKTLYDFLYFGPDTF